MSRSKKTRGNLNRAWQQVFDDETRLGAADEEAVELDLLAIEQPFDHCRKCFVDSLAGDADIDYFET